MKFLIIAFIAMFSHIVLADEVKVEVSPRQPVAGETFQAYFRIFTDSDQEPVINFNATGVEVSGKSNQGISTRTIYANGKLTVTREMTIVYDLIAARPGITYIRDINVQIGEKKIRHPSVSFNVLKEALAPADVFVMADVTKRSLYVGEGVVVRYYLYNKAPVSNLDVKKYPKLNNSLKRFLQEPERTERVAVDGQIYMRTQIYAAKLFPEKVGELKIDPLYLSVTYPMSRAGDPFGAFGLNRDFKTRTINSDLIKIDVKPLPEPIPPHFTGLVGAHDFQLQFGKNKLIVNEPLEVKLTISGVGALENLEAPTLIKHEGLEEFETNGDLKIANAQQATKVFDYTFLAKENFEMPAKTITLSYFDAEEERYISKELNIPEIVVAGGVPTSSSKDQSSKDSSNVEPTQTEAPAVVKDFAAPLIKGGLEWRAWISYVNLGLAIFAVLFSLLWVVKGRGLSEIRFSGEIPSSFKKGHFKFSEFVHWMTPIIQETGKSPLSIINESPLSEESKRYFIDLLVANDYKDYSSQKSNMEFKYQSRHFKELSRYIESVRNENSSQPA